VKKSPAPRAPAPLDFVLARVFDLYRELAARERVVNAKPRAAPSRGPRTVRGTLE
jgi:hypothetical protein